MDNIFYKADTITDFKEAFYELYNSFCKNNFEQKIFTTNLRDKKVLGTTLDISVDRKEVIQNTKSSVNSKKYLEKNTNRIDEYSEMIMYETLDHVETLSNELRSNHRMYKDKNNNEAVLIKVGIPENNLQEIYFNKASIKKLLKKVITIIKPTGYTLPYVQSLVKEGNKYFCYTLFIDRQYYKNGVTIESSNKSVRFKHNGKFVNKEAANKLKDENITVDSFAVGTLKYTSTKYWSTKVTNAWFGNLKSLEAKRIHFISTLKNLFNVNNLKNNTKLIKNRALKDYKKSQKNWKIILYNKMYWWLFRKNKAINTLIEAINNLYNMDKLKDIDTDYTDIIRTLERQRLSCQELELVTVDLVNTLNNNFYLTTEDVLDEIKNVKNI